MNPISFHSFLISWIFNFKNTKEHTNQKKGKEIIKIPLRQRKPHQIRLQKKPEAAESAERFIYQTDRQLGVTAAIK